MSQNVFYSCIIISRNYLNGDESVGMSLKEIADAYHDIKEEKKRIETEMNAWKRIYIDNVKACVSV